MGFCRNFDSHLFGNCTTFSFCRVRWIERQHLSFHSFRKPFFHSQIGVWPCPTLFFYPCFSTTLRRLHLTLQWRHLPPQLNCEIRGWRVWWIKRWHLGFHFFRKPFFHTSDKCVTLPYPLLLPSSLCNFEKTTPHSSMQESPTITESWNKRNPPSPAKN